MLIPHIPVVSQQGNYYSIERQSKVLNVRQA